MARRHAVHLLSDMGAGPGSVVVTVCGGWSGRWSGDWADRLTSDLDVVTCALCRRSHRYRLAVIRRQQDERDRRLKKETAS